MTAEPTLNLEEASASLSEIKSRLASDIKNRQAVIKPIETIVKALKDPHKNAVALYEASLELEKPPADVPLPETFAALAADVKHFAEEQLSELEFTFARDLREAFQAKDITLDGPPNRLTAGLFVLEPNMRKRQVDITFSRLPVTAKPVKLDVDQVVTAYGRAQREICERTTNLPELLGKMFEAWEQLVQLGKSSTKQQRVSIAECYRTLVMIRQPASFYRTPSQKTFVDYPKTHFTYDMLELRRRNVLLHNDKKLNFGTATIDATSGAMFLATGATEGAFIKDIYFSQE